MKLDGIELQVLIMGSPYEDALNNKPVHCIYCFRVPSGKGKHILENGFHKRGRTGDGTATEMRKRSRIRENETKLSLSVLPL